MGKSVNCQLGYLIDVISLPGKMARKKEWMRDVVLIVDAIALSKMTVYDRGSKSFVLLIDHGKAVPEPEATEATEALVFMVIGITGH